MSHLTCTEARAMVSDYIDGELEPASARALEAHLGGCASCPPLYAGLIATLAELKALGGPVGTIDVLVERVIDAVRTLGSPSAGR